MYWVIDGVNFHGAGRAGLRLTWVEYVTVKNVDSGWNGVWGIFTSFSNYLFFDNVTCHHSNQQHGIYISNSCANNVRCDSSFYLWQIFAYLIFFGYLLIFLKLFSYFWWDYLFGVIIKAYFY